MKDEEVFLSEADFHKNYRDLANLSKYHSESNISEFPFYENAREYIADDARWQPEESIEPSDPENLASFCDAMSKMKSRQFKSIHEEQKEPYINPYRKIGRNDPCPCGSGKKFKKCHGKGL